MFNNRRFVLSIVKNRSFILTHVSSFSFPELEKPDYSHLCILKQAFLSTSTAVLTEMDFRLTKSNLIGHCRSELDTRPLVKSNNCFSFRARLLFFVDYWKKVWYEKVPWTNSWTISTLNFV